MKDLENLLKILLDHHIDFVVIGGLAATLHGSSIVTQDVDICASLSAEDIQKFRECLGPYHPMHRMSSPKLSFLEIPEDGKPLNNLYLSTDLGTLDILGTVTGIGDYQQVLKNSIQVEIFGEKCRVLSIEALIKAKEEMGREKDKATIRELNLIKDKN